MSVLIGMLHDLDRRGAPLPIGPGLRSAIETAPPAALPARRFKPRTIVRTAAGAFACALAGAALVAPPSWFARAPNPATPAGSVAIATAPAGPPSALRKAPRRKAAPSRQGATAVLQTKSATPTVPAQPDGEAIAAAAARSTAAAAPAPAPPPDPALPVDRASEQDPVPAAQLIRRSGSAEDEAADLARAEALSSHGHGAEAVILLQRALLDWPAHAATRRALAALLQADGQDAAARDLLLEGAARDPGRFAVAAARLQAQDDQLDAARATLARVPQAQRDADYHALVAAIAQRTGQVDLAVAEYQAAVAAGPAHAVWFAGLGAALEQLGRADEARAAYRKALALAQPSSTTADFARQRAGALAR
jgi:hypothetical protein